MLLVGDVRRDHQHGAWFHPGIRPAVHGQHAVPAQHMQELGRVVHVPVPVVARRHGQLDHRYGVAGIVRQSRDRQRDVTGDLGRPQRPGVRPLGAGSENERDDRQKYTGRSPPPLDHAPASADARHGSVRPPPSFPEGKAAVDYPCARRDDAAGNFTLADGEPSPPKSA